MYQNDLNAIRLSLTIAIQCRVQILCHKCISITALYNPYFPICDFRNPNSPTPLGTNWPQYTAERGEYMGLSSNMTVRYKMRPNKMALWNELLPSLGETVKPTRSSDVRTTIRKPDDKKGIIIKSKYEIHCMYLIWLCFFSYLFYFTSNYKSDRVHRSDGLKWIKLSKHWPKKFLEMYIIWLCFFSALFYLLYILVFSIVTIIQIEPIAVS